MADDLEAFLRQAAQRRAQQPAAAVPRPVAPPQPLVATPIPAPPPTVPSRPTPPQSTTAAAPPAPVAPPLAERVGTRVSTTAIEQRVGQLGEEVGQADEHMMAHLAQTFDQRAGVADFHDFGALDETPADQVLNTEELVAMLRDPRRVPYAIVLSEVLVPPIRW